MFKPLLMRVERLENREMPAVWGVPWPNGEHLTLSFAPDGTRITGAGSNLGEVLAGVGPQAELDILKAFQTWAVNANINIGLVSDNGGAFGNGREVQGDARFGGIRIGGRQLAPDVLAVTAPFALYNDYSGDVVVNTAAIYGNGGRDLFTVLLHEAGHAFGIGDNLDTSSVEYRYYQGAETGLSAGDVAAIQALYGARSPDRYEGASGNDTLTTATRYNGPINADITTASDADVYRFTTGLLTTSVSVHLQAAGLSLLTSKVELLDSAGSVVAAGATTDPTNNNVSLTFSNLRAGQTYYVRVSAARPDVFGVGAYQLNITQNSLFTGITGLLDGLLTDTGLNNTLATALSLVGKTVTTSAPETQFNVQGSFVSPSDVDYYRITVPPGGYGPQVLLSTIWGENGATLNPWVEVYNLSGQQLSGEVLTADGSTTTLQVPGLLAGGTYFIRVASDTGATGGYNLAADLQAAPATLPALASGNLTAAAPAASAGFSLTSTAQVHLVVSAAGAFGTVNLVVTDAQGNEVATLSAVAGRSRSMDLFLQAGDYHVTVATADGSPLAYQIGLVVVTDPVGVQQTDPTQTPQPTSPPPSDPPPSPPPPPPPPAAPAPQ